VRKTERDMRKQAFAFALISRTYEADDSRYIPIGTVVEIDLHECGGMDEFILTDSNDVVPLKRHCQIQPYRKGWLSDFWFI
jgi:hypothetical protein